MLLSPCACSQGERTLGWGAGDLRNPVPVSVSHVKSQIFCCFCRTRQPSLEVASQQRFSQGRPEGAFVGWAGLLHCSAGPLWLLAHRAASLWVLPPPEPAPGGEPHPGWPGCTGNVKSVRPGCMHHPCLAGVCLSVSLLLPPPLKGRGLQTGIVCRRLEPYLPLQPLLFYLFF